MLCQPVKAAFAGVGGLVAEYWTYSSSCWSRYR